MIKKFAVLTGMLVLMVFSFGCFNQSNVAPMASFVCVTENPCAGEQTYFDALASFDPDGSIVSYQWDFYNDGKLIAKGQKTSCWYQSAETFTVKLTVTDSDGALGTYSAQVMVAPIVGETSVSIKNLDDLDSNDYCTCQRVQIEIQNALGPCAINWGDGRVDIGNSSEHKYHEPGLYNLVVTDSPGNELRNQPIYIEACCFEPPTIFYDIPRFVSSGSTYALEIEDPDQIYTCCCIDIPRPMCQRCGDYQIARGPANDAGICLILASFYVLDGGARQELANFQKLDLDNPVLRIPNLPSGWYEVVLLIADDDPDCDYGRQKVEIIQFRIM